MKKFIRSLLSAFIEERRQNQLYQKIDLVLMQNGRIWSNTIKNATNVKRLEEVGFKVYSQWDEDGIIQYLVAKIPIKNKTFIEFGVENYEEANTRFLLANNNWSGMIIDGSKENIDHVCSSPIMWQRNLSAIAEFITKDNINELLLQSGFDKDLGLLSVDIDGNDYWVFKAIEVMNPRILILEYNPIWGGEKKVTIPYDETFVRGNRHYSYLYYGMSFAAAIDLATQKGYTYVGSNCQNSNAFFVRNDLKQYLELDDMDNSWQMSNVRESRDEKGKLTYLNSEKSIELINNMDIFDITTGEIKKIYELYQ